MSQKVVLRKSAGGVRFQSGAKVGVRSAVGIPSSWNATERTFEFVLASEKPVRNWRITADGRDIVEVDEILKMSGLRDLESFVGAPLLQEHAAWKPPIGVIESARVENRQLICEARLSKRADLEDLAKDIGDGIRRCFSIRWDGEKEAPPVIRTGKRPLVEVTSWTAVEGSLVTLPADNTAQIRSARPAVPSTTTNGAPAMTPEELNELIEGFRSASDSLMTALEGLSTEDAGDEDDTDDVEAEALAAAAAVRAKAAKKPAGKEAKTVTPAAEAAKVRNLREACKRNGRSADFDALVASGASVDKLQELLVASVRTNGTEIDTTSKPGAGGARKMIRLGQTVAAPKTK